MAKKPKQQPSQKKEMEKVADLSPEEIAKIKAIVYKGKSDMCWFSPDRKEAKALIKLAEAYFRVVDAKDHALNAALNRLETIQYFSKIQGHEWDSVVTQQRIKLALGYNGKEE